MSKKLPKLCIVAGVPRSGSTFLYHYLGAHPEIFKPFRKETNYFLTNYERGIDWYLSLFSNIQPEQIALDVSPSYFFDEITIQRIKAYPGEKRILITVREPADYALSWYQQQLTHYKNFMPFDQFLDGWTATRGDGTLYTSLVDGDYYHHLKKYLSAFGPELLVYRYEAMSENPLDYLQHIESFIGVSPYYNKSNFKNKIINSSSRRNITFLAYFLSREWVISAIEKLVPRKITIFLRDLFDSASKPAEVRSYSEKDIERLNQVRKVMKEDIDFYKNLFADSDHIYGKNE